MTSRRGPRDDDELGAIEDEIASYSYFGRMARWFFDLATFHVFDNDVRREAQRNAQEMGERADKWREIKKRKRAQYRDDNPWR